MKRKNKLKRNLSSSWVLDLERFSNNKVRLRDPAIRSRWTSYKSSNITVASSWVDTVNVRLELADKSAPNIWNSSLCTAFAFEFGTFLMVLIDFSTNLSLELYPINLQDHTPRFGIFGQLISITFCDFFGQRGAADMTSSDQELSYHARRRVAADNT